MPILIATQNIHILRNYKIVENINMTDRKPAGISFRDCAEIASTQVRSNFDRAGLTIWVGREDYSAFFVGKPYDTGFHRNASVLRMFSHRQFLSLFWILMTILLNIFSVRFSLDLLVRGNLFRLYSDLVSVRYFHWIYSCSTVSTGVFRRSDTWSR
jgi:hypothetical protein